MDKIKRLKARRRKVASLAAYSRQHTVRNCTIPKADPSTLREVECSWKEGGKPAVRMAPKDSSWTIPKEGYKQPKPLFKKGWKIWRTKEDRPELPIPMWERHVEKVKSQFPDPREYQKMLWKNLGKAAKMKAYEDEKMKKWEKKHPKPCPDDDLFKDEMIPQWEKEREEALIRIRDFVVSMFDKLPLSGRFKESDNKFTEKPVAEIKDINGEGHRVNELDENSKLLKKAQKITNETKAKNAKLVATNLKDHKHKKGRMILPKAA